MKSIFIFIIFFLPLVIAEATEKITIKITSIDTNRGGNLMVFVFSEKGFPLQHKDALVSKTILVTEETMIIKLAAPQDSNLAFKVLHDEDSNNKVTKNWTGIWPAEGLAFSNGKTMGTFGPPNFSQAKKSRESALAGVTLKLVYP